MMIRAKTERSMTICQGVKVCPAILIETAMAVNQTAPIMIQQAPRILPGMASHRA